MQKLEFIVDSKHNQRNITIDATFLEDDHAKPIVLFIHGFKGFKDWGTFNLIAETFAKNGFAFVKINLSHNGTTLTNPLDFADLEAFGNNNFTIELDDIQTVLDWLVSGHSEIPNIDLTNIYLIGHSRGGGVSLLKTSEDDRIKKLATWASIHQIPRFDEETIAKWKQEGVLYIWNSRTEQNMPLYWQLHDDVIHNEARFDILERAKCIQCPVLVAHGTHDETVPVEAAHALAKNLPHAELLIIEDSGHTFEGYHPFDEDELPQHLQQVVEKTISFFKS